MKNIFSYLPIKGLKSLVVIGAFAAICGGAATAYAWSPDRPTFTWQNPAPYVTFDSITNNPNYGDERTFFDAKNSTDTTSGNYTDQNQVTNGEIVLMRVYVHNDAASNLDDPNNTGPGVAHNASVRVYLPTATATSLQANAYVDASNATPTEVADSTAFSASTPFSLSYIAGSAVAYNNANPSGMPINDSIVTTGAPIGYQNADGTVPGCFQYVNIVTIKVRVNMPEYKITKQVRFLGQTSSDWKKSVTANEGDTLQWAVSFTDSGSTPLNQVMMVDNVPAGLDVVPGTVVLYNGNYPSGYTMPDSSIQANGRQININLGDYLPLSDTDQQNGLVSAKVVYNTKVNDTTDCGVPTLTNTAYTTPQGYGAIYDTATSAVNTGKTCQTTPPAKTTSTTPTALVNTGPGDVVGMFAATTVAGAVAHRLYWARRLANRG